MSDTYYCRHGETYNGDGSTNAAAAGDGLAGAFNDAVACIDGTQSGPGDDDTIIYKTTQTDDSTNVSLTATATVVFARRVHIFDDGTEWPGAGGTFEYHLNTAGDFDITGIGTIVEGNDLRLELYRDYASSEGNTNVFNGAVARGVHIFNPAGASNQNQNRFVVAGTESYSRIENCKKTYRNDASISQEIRDVWLAMSSADDGCKAIVRNMTVDCAGYNCFGITVDSDSRGEGSSVIVDGLTYENVGSGSKLISYNVSGSDIVIKNVTYDSPTWHPQENVVNSPDVHYTYVSGIQNINTGNEYTGGYALAGRTFTAYWIPGKFYPTLTATTLTGDKWSWRVEPNADSSTQYPETVAEVYHYNDQGAASKVITWEWLLYDQYATPTKEDFWITVMYTDTTGVYRYETTLLKTDPASSTASWDATNYGPINFDKYKLELTTEHSVANNSYITVEFASRIAEPNTDAFYFLHPDVSVVDA